MSVVGFDLGGKGLTAAVAQRGGIDIICNDVSNRKTPVMVGFKDSQRFIGESGLSQYPRNPQNTVTYLQRIIGRKWQEQELQEELKYLPYKAIEQPGGNVGIQVMYNGEAAIFSPEEVLGMFLAKMKEISEVALENKVRDVVVGVPSYFTSNQRRAVYDAVEIADLHCMNLINDTTAAALAWGIYKEFDEKEPTHVMFYDLGDTGTQVCVAAFTKGKLKILAHAYDRTLGGRNFHRALAEHFIEEFKNKYKIDVSTNVRAKARLEAACEKVKIILSANQQAPLNVESLMEDRDVSGMVTRDEFEKMCGSLFARAAEPAKKAFLESGLDISQLNSIELAGGASRMPQVAAALKEALGKECSRTLNAEEIVGKGCALQCAMLSPVFKVKEFKVEDISAYPITVSWHDLDAMDKEESAELFPKGTTFPALKAITFPKGKPFELRAAYSPSAELPPGTDHYLGTWTVADVPSTETGEAGKIRVKVRLDLNSIFNVESADLVETLPPLPEQPSSPSTEQPQTPPAAAGDQQQQETPAADVKEEKKEPPKPRIKHHELLFKVITSGLTPSRLADAMEEERKRIAQDLNIRETAERKNNLESYVYDTRSSLDYELVPYATDDVRAKFSSLLSDTADWLYGDGMETQKEVYVARLADLTKIGNPIVKRKREDEERPHVLKELQDTINEYLALADSTDPKYEHISSEDRSKVKAKCEEAIKAVFPKVEQTNAKPKTEDPLIWCDDITHWKDNLNSFCPVIMNKPKPAPPKKEEKKEPEAPPKAEQKEGETAPDAGKADMDTGN